ncbi:hypothetical protein Trydic_g11848 [Trypoxylus dichotomus]
MSKLICRLCLNDRKLINIFDNRLTNSEQLRKCILLGTGVEICPNDVVTKYICQYCSDLAVFLYRYRKKALANDKALKELANQVFVEPLQKIDDIAQLNRFLLKDVMTDDEIEACVAKSGGNESKLFKKGSSVDTNFAVHPSVIELIKTHPKIKIPNDLLKCNIQPRIVLDPNEVKDWEVKDKEVYISRQPISDIERFKLLCPSIQITKITKTSENNAEKTLCTETDKLKNIMNKRKSSVSPSSNSSKRKKTNSSSSFEEEVYQNVPVVSELQVKTYSKRWPKPEALSISKESSQSKALTDHCEIGISSAEDENEDATLKASAENKNEIALAQESTETESEVILPKRLSKKRFLFWDSDSDSELEVNNDESLLQTIEEETVVSCGVCNKMFNTRQQLGSHERIHRRCIICNKMFRSADVLFSHQQEICFKTLIANPPNLELIRVDEQPDIVHLYPEAFDSQNGNESKMEEYGDVLCISDDDEDDVVIVDATANATATANDAANEPPDADHAVDISEYQQICRIFRKYRDVRLPVMKAKATETKPRICIKYNVKNQIVLEKMYSELKIYRVPVELVAKSSSFAYISFARKPPGKNNFYCWANEPVIGLSDKSSILSTLLTPSPHYVQSKATQPLAPVPLMTKVLDSAVQQSTTTPQPIIIKAALSRNFTYSSTVSSAQILQQATSSNPTNVVTNLVSTPIFFVPTPAPAASTPINITSAPTPSTSTTKDNNFNLRVKTLSELL